MLQYSRKHVSIGFNGKKDIFKRFKSYLFDKYRQDIS
jgi:hypothetical protein